MGDVMHLDSKRELSGVYTLAQFPHIEEPVTWSTGISGLDRNFRPFTGSFCVFTGIPGHGKTTFVQRLAFNMARLHNFKIGMASFENPPVPYVRNAFRQMYLNGYPSGNALGIKASDNWVNEHFAFIGPLPGSDDEEEAISLEWVLERSREAVKRFGIKFLILDPWNEIQHGRKSDETETEYTGRAIQMLKRFARVHDCAVWVVAHPKKMGGGGDDLHIPNLYDIAGSANWANKADMGIVVNRNDMTDECVDIHIKKSRFRNAGTPGVVNLKFDEKSEDFLPLATRIYDE